MPIAILSFNRPQYLTAVLRSLRPQIGRDDRVVLFQDGPWNPHSRQYRGNPRTIEACTRAFKKIIPWGTVAESEHNLGIAENYERAEQEMFGRLQSPSALFLEDDLVLSPGFLDVTQMLLDLAAVDPRIAYVSAYGNMWADRQEQMSRARDLMHMHENWGFAMTRQAWLDERPFRSSYLDLIRGRDYGRQRDHAVIVNFYRSRGWNMKVTSQDGARWIASLELCKVRLTTFQCHARYIGREGVHADQTGFDHAHFDRAVMFEGKPVAPAAPTDAQIRRWLETERARYQVAPAAFYPGHPTGEWP